MEIKFLLVKMWFFFIKWLILLFFYASPPVWQGTIMGAKLQKIIDKKELLPFFIIK